jgi:hypothetical protein
MARVAFSGGERAKPRPGPFRKTSPTIARIPRPRCAAGHPSPVPVDAGAKGSLRRLPRVNALALTASRDHAPGNSRGSPAFRASRADPRGQRGAGVGQRESGSGKSTSRPAPTAGYSGRKQSARKLRPAGDDHGQRSQRQPGATDAAPSPRPVDGRGPTRTGGVARNRIGTPPSPTSRVARFPAARRGTEPPPIHPSARPPPVLPRGVARCPISSKKHTAIPVRQDADRSEQRSARFRSCTARSPPTAPPVPPGPCAAARTIRHDLRPRGAKAQKLAHKFCSSSWKPPGPPIWPSAVQMERQC